MTDKRIEELASGLRDHLEGVLKNPYDYDAREPLPAEVEPHELEAIVSETERAFIKACYLVEFKRLRASGRLLDPGAGG